MTDPISRTEQINAALDAATIAAVVNGSISPGTILSREGVALHTMAYLQSQIPGGAHLLTPDGGSIVTGAAGANVYGIREDAAYGIYAATGHALFCKTMLDPTEEAADTDYGFNSDDAPVQLYAEFTRFQGDVNTTASWRAVRAGHLPSGNGDDIVPFIWDGNGAIRLGAGATASEPWATPGTANCLDVQSSGVTLLRNGLVACKSGAGHNFSVTSGFAAEFYGYIQSGDVSGGATENAVQIGYSTGGATGFVQAIRNSDSAALPMLISGSSITLGGGHSYPDNDNVRTCGASGRRWSVVYAGTGTINTSDATEKTIRGDGRLTEAELAWAKKIEGLRKVFQWNDAIAQKGEGAARLHVGFLAQEVISAANGLALDPFRFAFICRDHKTKEVIKTITEKVQKTEPVEHKIEVVEPIDGRAVLKVVPKIEMVPVFQELPVFDESGNPVMRTATQRGNKRKVSSVLGPRGQAVLKSPEKTQIQMTHRVPVMVDGPPKQISVTEPDVGANGEQLFVYGLRYEVLQEFLAMARVQAAES